MSHSAWGICVWEGEKLGEETLIHNRHPWHLHSKGVRVARLLGGYGGPGFLYRHRYPAGHPGGLRTASGKGRISLVSSYNGTFPSFRTPGSRDNNANRSALAGAPRVRGPPPLSSPPRVREIHHMSQFVWHPLLLCTCGHYAAPAIISPLFITTYECSHLPINRVLCYSV